KKRSRLTWGYWRNKRIIIKFIYMILSIPCMKCVVMLVKPRLFYEDMVRDCKNSTISKQNINKQYEKKPHFACLFNSRRAWDWKKSDCSVTCERFVLRK